MTERHLAFYQCKACSCRTARYCEDANLKATREGPARKSKASRCAFITHLYRFSVEWHMQLMHWLPAKLVSTDFSSASWYLAATADAAPQGAT